MMMDEDYLNPFDAEFRPDPPYSDEEYQEIREVCGLLLSQWCVVRHKDPESKRCWDLIANTRYRPQIEKNLSNVNMELVVVDASMRELAYVRSGSAQGHVRFSKAESIVILRANQLLQQSRAKVALSSTPASCPVDIQDLMSACNVGVNSKNAIDLKTMKAIVYHLEQYHLLRVEEKRKKDFHELTTVTILPSIQQLLKDPSLEGIDRVLTAYLKEGRSAGADREETETAAGEVVLPEADDEE